MKVYLLEEDFRCKLGLDKVKISEYKIEQVINLVKQLLQQYVFVIKY